MANLYKYLLVFLLSFCVLCLIYIITSRDRLKIIACDVGQGDAILAQLNSTQILIDAGPGTKVLDCLGKYMPYWDREIELVVITHPQMDHYGGFLSVFSSYQAQNVLIGGLGASSQEYRLLEKMVGGSNTKVIYAGNTQGIRFDLMYLDILHPSISYLSQNSSPANCVDCPLTRYASTHDPNDFSIVTRLRYLDFDALFTGDMGVLQADIVINKLQDNKRNIEYLKVPHHGSKNGMTRSFLEEISPDVAVMSLGKDNSYGHPHKEITKMLTDLNIKTFRTDEMGDVIVETDGKAIFAPLDR